MTNFDYLLENELYNDFATQAIEAEQSISISPSSCAILVRRAVELAVRFVYVYDDELVLPYRDNVSALIHEPSFRSIIEPRLFPLIKFAIHLGNIAVHTNNNISRDEAVVALRNLFEFCDWINYCYSDEYIERIFDESLLATGTEKRVRAEELKQLYEELSNSDQRLQEMRAENESLRREMSLARQQHTKARTFNIDEISEAETRKKYIDLQLKEAGWVKATNMTEEEPVEGMPNSTGTGFVDYVLWGKDSLPLAVVEAKKASTEPIVGSHQAKLYADCLQNKYGQRPLIFTTNGFEIFYTNDYCKESARLVSGFFTQEELQLEVDRRNLRKPLERLEINDNITNRPYQKEAVTAVCEAITNHHRKMLIVQATGSGKTRVSISIVDILRKHNYVKNILFLADRKALVKQAKKNYTNLLPDLSCCNLLDSKDDPESARMIFSTYPTMLNAIDEKKNKYGEKLFTPAHFDLIIVDESHRSIYKKYQDIFTYFDAMLLGMTATPKNEIDKNTYGVFDLERGVPTFAYELESAVEDGYLVDYSTLEYKTQIMEDGIHYNDLSEEEKEEYENTFDDEEYGEDISSSAINEWLFNADTIDKVLGELVEKGLKVEGGDKLGKTIIFAKNSLHAQAIVDRFNKRYPEFGGDFIKQIDYSIKYVDALIDDFSTKEKFPQIAVSVDMLDTGIDIPEILNLVFFKKVKSYSKFWQMIGRGTRLCPDLFGEGVNKEKFLIFDFCNNFEYFRADKKGSETGIGESLSEKLFNTKVMIARELQGSEYTVEEDLCEFRDGLVKDLHKRVIELDDNSFRVKIHMKYVEMFRDKAKWTDIQTTEVSIIKEHISPIIIPEKGDELAKRFDYVMYSICLGLLQSKNVSKPISIVMATGEKLSKKGTIPQVKAKMDVIEKVQETEFWDGASVIEIDRVREEMRELIPYIDGDIRRVFYTNFTDSIIDMAEGQPIYDSINLQNYKKKVEYYLKEHQDNLAVYKLRNNKKLSEGDLNTLEAILWKELGSKEDYQKEYGDTPVGRLVRRIVGVDRMAVNEAFSEFLSEERLNVNQIRFVRLIIDYIVENGNIDDNKVLMDDPFRTVGSITTLFKDDMTTARQIMDVIQEIKRNSEEIA